jgi:hypothetical protein
MRKGFSKTPMAAFVPYDASFTDGLFSLAGPPEHAQELAAVAVVLNSSVAHYWYLMTASSWGVEREQLHQREWLSLPLPHLDDETAASLRAVEGPADESWRSAVDRIVERDVYKLTDDERQVIADALTIRLAELQDGPAANSYDAPDVGAFEDYARALERHMGDLQLGEWSASLDETDQGFARVTCTHAEAINRPAVEPRFKVDNLIKTEGAVLEESLSSATIVEPQAVILDNDRIHLVKPNRRTNWMISSASTDATEIFDAILKSELTYARDSNA